MISAEIWKLNVCTAVFLSSCFDSLISILEKYPERFSAVMKLATPLTEADAPSIVRVLPLRIIDVSQRFSVRETVLAISSSSSWPPVRSRCSCSMVETRCCRTAFCFSKASTCCLICSRSVFCACSCLILRVLVVQLPLPGVVEVTEDQSAEQNARADK